MDRRRFFECMAWAGTGTLWTMSGGVLSSRTLAEAADNPAAAGTFSFAQISDTHVGFKGEANKDVMGTLAQSIARINALPAAPEFLIHTGDLTHTQKAGSFDTLTESLKAVKTDRIFFIPGEHDVFADGGTEFLARYGKGTVGRGWQSFDYKGAHFVGLINVLNFKAGGVGNLGPEQLDWLRRDLEALTASTPVVVFSHIPLWAVYPSWGWVTDDGEQALAYLRRFGSVTVLNGHIHQILQKVEGTITFHSAVSTAYPQPKPGAGPSAGPLKVPEGDLARMLGVREINVTQGKGPLAVVDAPLS